MHDNLRRISSAEAATFAIRCVLADFYALMCSGWPTPVPLPEWHVPLGPDATLPVFPLSVGESFALGTGFLPTCLVWVGQYCCHLVHSEW